MAANGIDDTKQVIEKIESDSHSEGSSVVSTNLSPGRVVRRRKTSSKNLHTNRASFPQARPQFSESKVAQDFEHKMTNLSFTHNDDSMDSSTDRLEGMCSSI